MRYEAELVSNGRNSETATRNSETATTPFEKWGEQVPVDVTPSWVGGDSAIVRGADRDGNLLLRRTMLKACAAYAAPFPSIANVMQAAGEAGLAPKVIAIEGNAVVMEDLSIGWHRGKLADFSDPHLFWAALDCRRRVHDLSFVDGKPALRDTIDNLFIMRDLLVDSGTPLPHGVDAMLDKLTPFLHAASTFRETAVLCHGDGAASNLLVRDVPIGEEVSPQVLLSGWTVSGMMDPLEEAGSVLSEISPFCGMPADQMLYGLGLSAECLPIVQAYSVLDGIRWALIGLWRSATAEDPSIDYAKYGLWRLTKAHVQMSDARFASWLRRL